MATGILYPGAYAQPYEAVHIEDAQRGRPYFCFGCDREMVMRRGPKRSPHFAHKAGFVQCEKDNTLHESAKAFICQGFLRAVATGGEYQVGYPCERCKTPISVNIATKDASIASERVVVKGTRSDLAVFQPDRSPRVIIEVVVTHDLESDTKQRYEEANCPVVTIEPSWDTLPDLRRAAIGSRILNMKEDKHRYCSDCRDALKKEAEARAQAAETCQRKMRQAKKLVAGIMPHSGKIPPITSITRDRYGSPLKWHTRKQVMTNARKLVWLGFQQQKKRPTLFLHQTGRWKIYADLDSTEVMRIWEVDCEPALYAFGKDASGCRECLLEAVGEIFDQHKMPYRRYFEDPGVHDHTLPYEYGEESTI